LTLAAANGASAEGLSASATYRDAVGDAGDAPYIARVAIGPEPDRFVVDVKLAKPTELGRYGWISDLRTRSFDFAVASLRQQADLAPGGGVAKYPRRN
jgi:hypothetical protein